MKYDPFLTVLYILLAISIAGVGLSIINLIRADNKRNKKHSKFTAESKSEFVERFLAETPLHLKIKVTVVMRLEIVWHAIKTFWKDIQ